MKTRLAAVVMISLVTGVLARLSPAEDSITREIQALFDSVAASFDKKDVDGIASTAVPEATLRFINGTSVTLDQWKANAKKDFADMGSMKSEFKVEKAQVEGDTALATYTERHEYVLTSEKDHTYVSVSRWSATLTKTPEGWRGKRYVQLSETMMRDGKPFMPLTASEGGLRPKPRP